MGGAHKSLRHSSLLLPVVVAGSVVGCLSDASSIETRVEGIAIPGPWMPPASTQAIAATEHVAVVDPPPVSPGGSCTSSDPFRCSCTHPECTPAYPGTRALDAYVRARWSYLRPGGLYCCRQNSAMTTVPYLSVHSIGRAIDLMVTMIGGDADNTAGDPVANWLVENAEYIGIQRVIWDHWVWNGEHGFRMLPSTSLSHTNHIHVELSVDGAHERTPFFTSGAVNMSSCTPHCDGNRVIAADCSSTDCAAVGSVCTSDGPVQCSAPPPPEAPAMANAGAALPSVQPIAAPGRVTFIGPSRVFDTRTAAESTRLVRTDGLTEGPLAGVATVSDWSAFGLPSGTTGVWTNFTAIGRTAAGFARGYSAGAAVPPTSNVNFDMNEVRANAMPVVFGASNGVVFEANTPVDLVDDLYAAFSPTGSGLEMAGPNRVLDTRGATPLTAGSPMAFSVLAPAGSTGVTGTVAVISRTAPGFVRAFPCGAEPMTSTVNFAPGSVVSNAFVSALDGSGQLCLSTNVDVDVVVDVTGYLSPSGTLSYVGLAPQRLLDTRDPASLYTGRLDSRQTIEIPISTLPGMPANVGAVVANVTALGADVGGYIVAYPCGRDVPGSSSLNFPPHNAVNGLVVSSIENGRLCLFAFQRAHLVVDVLGVWTRTDGTMAPDAGVNGNPTDNGDDLEPTDPDAGTDDAAAPSDADGGADGGTTAPAGSCACRADAPAGSHRGREALVAFGVVAAALASRKRKPQSQGA